jgi:hypothetical protein
VGREVVTQRVTEANSCSNRLTAASGVRSASKGQQHDEVIVVAIFGYVWSGREFPGVESVEEFLARHANQASSLLIEEGHSLLWRQFEDVGFFYILGGFA